MLNVVAYTGGLNVPSARFRVRQYIKKLEENGVALEEVISRSGSFPPETKIARMLWAANTIIEKIPQITNNRNYDLTLLQREMISTYYTFERFTKSPRVLDVDDAIFLNGDGEFAKKLAQKCQHIICGNEFLANKFSQWNKEISVLATGVDSDLYKPIRSNKKTDAIVIGWIGTSSNFVYLTEIQKALRTVVNIHPNVLIRIVSDVPPDFINFSENFQFIKWSESTEVKRIQEFDIGIMPLKNTEMAQGKCSFKMLQYMSCGKPVVASPIGMNSVILKQGDFGFGASSTEDWVDALNFLIEDHKSRDRMGQNGRNIIEKKYSINVLGPQYANLLKKVAAT